jgi:hypothetical protein
MLLTFRTGLEALEAIKYDEQHMLGEEIRVRLRTPHWHDFVESDLRDEFLDAPASSSDTRVSTLLVDDLSIPSLPFYIEGVMPIVIDN